MSRSRLILLNIFLLVDALAVDQLTKWFAMTSPKPWVSGDVLFLHYALSATINRVFAFSIPAPTPLVIAVVLAVLVLVGSFWIRELRAGNRASLALALVIAGALGNLIDRFRVGGVIDFVELSVANLTWSSFNVADLLIVLGALLWVIFYRRVYSPVPLTKNTYDAPRP
jgi:signal peptidase II